MLARTYLRIPRTRVFPTTRSASRPLSSTVSIQARKDSQGKDDLKPEGNEYSKSASDDQAARMDDTAYSRDKTTPESHMESAAKEEGSAASNPLNASPANHDISQPRPGTEGGAESSASQSGKGPSDRQRSSGGSQGEHKAGKGKLYD